MQVLALLLAHFFTGLQNCGNCQLAMHPSVSFVRCIPPPPPTPSSPHNIVGKFRQRARTPCPKLSCLPPFHMMTCVY